MYPPVALPAPVALVPGRPLAARLVQHAERYPGLLPSGVTQLVSELNGYPQGVAATVDEPRNGGDHSLLLHTRTYVVRLFVTRSGDAYTVAGINPMQLADQHRLASGALMLRAEWHAKLEPREVPPGFRAQWDVVHNGWTALRNRPADRRAVTEPGPAHTRYLDRLDRLIDATQRIAGERQNAPASYPYGKVESVAERRYSAEGVYAFHIVGKRFPVRNKYVGIRGARDYRGQVRRVEGDRVLVRFDRLIDRKELPEQGELEETAGDVVHTKRREAVRLLRTQRERNRSLLPVLVDHRLKPVQDVSDRPGEELDEDQLAAFRMALGVQDLALVLGPPGTGKTRTISEIARACALAPDRGPVLVTSHTNRAVDNVLVKLPKDVVVIRVGSEGKVDPDGRQFLLEQLAADLRREAIGRAETALRGYATLPQARQWLPVLAQRTEAMAAAFGALVQERHELERIRYAAGGPVRDRITELRAGLAGQDQLLARRHGELGLLVSRDERARARRWWPPFAALARAAARRRERRITACRAQFDTAAAEAGRLRTEIATAEHHLNVVIHDVPPVRAARQAAALAEQRFVASRDEVEQALRAIRSLVAAVDALPAVAIEGDPAQVLDILRRLNAWLPGRLDVLAAREKLLAEWRVGISGAVDQLYPELIRYADVIGATCIGSASRTELADVEFDLAIVDEAGQIGTADVLIPLVRARRAVLVGDHRQLPPFVGDGVADWADGTGDAETTALVTKSTLEMLVDEVPGSHVVRLTRQRRMPRVIADFISDMFYDGTLRTMVERTPDTSLFAKPLAFVDTSGLPERERAESAAPGGRKGTVNHAEARVLGALAEYYHRRGVEWALIVPYAAQVKLIAELLGRSIRDSDAIDGNIGTVDSFQGGERDVILYGFTRSNRRGSVGFLDELRRANVAFTRAKQQLVLVGDMDMLLRATDTRFRELATSLRDHVRDTGDVRKYAEFMTDLEGLR
ncbi:DEAD/DEAH box helicase [Amycolatopsis samaneae]|uniref:DEAD/DEAH box helicase n=1 Tax=Amycolatopsis samaneae TaxID=664691 RepID=A0ABW5G8P3_9PSEU